MRVKEFRIYRYGPLTDSKRVVLGDFNLFFGRNEEGKTLTIDGLVRVLLSKKATKNVFKGIDRVDNNPEGYAIIENEGKDVKFPEEGDLISLIGLSPQEWRNIFIIRNSDLSIAEEETFYTGVTDRLTGLKSKKIIAVKNRLREMGKLTRPDSSGRLSDRETDEKLQSRVEHAKTLIKTIGDLKKAVESEGLDKVERTIEDMGEELQRIDVELSNLEDAQRREKYEKGIEALKRLKNALKELKKLELYNEDDERKFRDLERDIQNANEEIKKHLSDLKTKDEELKNCKRSREESEKHLRVLNERRKILEEEQIDMKRYEELSERLVQIKAKISGEKPLAIISVFLFALSLIGTIIRPLPILRIFLVLFFASMIYFSAQLIRASRINTSLSKLFEKIRLSLAPVDISSDSMEGILSLVQRFKEKFEEKEMQARNLEGNTSLLEREIEGIKGRIRGLEGKRRDCEISIDEIKRRSNVESLKEYRERLEGKLELENTIREYAAVLGSLFGKGGYSDKNEIIVYWERSVSDLEAYRDKAVEVKYSDVRKGELHQKKEMIEDEKEEFEKKRRELEDNLKQIEREAQNVLKKELCCGTLRELSFVQKMLQEFVVDIEKNVENVLSVMCIFEEIEEEEERKISRFFGKGSSVSKYFSRITDGLYTTVDIDTSTQEKKVLVHTKNKNVLDALKLSGGAYDQLYLSIRLALGGELLEKGFFIMDDPFIKSDIERLQRQIELLWKIVDEGWQILYFTAKEEVKEALKKEILEERVNLIETNWITLW